MSSTSQEFYKSEHNLKYDSRTSLNTYDIHIPVLGEASDTTSDTKYWILYIHGGAWRDPLITSLSLLPNLPNLSPSSLPIAGLISINYSLTRYASHPTHSSPSDEPSRNATHPEHIEDVLTAIRFLQWKYEFGREYVLVGHSCGATMAFQSVMGAWKPRKSQLLEEDGDEKEKEEDGLILPSAVIGVSGIYDIPLLVQTHEHPIYREFTTDSFSSDESLWKTASPVRGSFSKTWPSGTVAVLAHSDEDGLVDWDQTEMMSGILWKEKKSGRRDKVIKLKGTHFEIVDGGLELVKAIKEGLSILEEGNKRLTGKAIDQGSKND